MRLPRRAVEDANPPRQLFQQRGGGHAVPLRGILPSAQYRFRHGLHVPHRHDDRQHRLFVDQRRPQRRHLPDAERQQLDRQKHLGQVLRRRRTVQHPDRPVGKAPRTESRQQRKHHRRGQIHPRMGLFQPRPTVGRRTSDDRSGLLHQGRQYPPRAFVGRRRLFDHHLRHGMGRQNRRGKTVGYQRFFGRKLSADHLAGCSQDAAGPDVPCPQRVHERYRDAQTLRRGYAGK